MTVAKVQGLWFFLLLIVAVPGLAAAEQTAGEVVRGGISAAEQAAGQRRLHAWLVGEVSPQPRSHHQHTEPAPVAWLLKQHGLW